jgi:hypothetical protein
MYGNSSFMIDRLMRQKEEIDNLIKNYQNTNQQPVNNFISTNQTQTPPKDLVEWRILNENEEVDNLYVQNKTFFINDKKAILKGVDGSLTKWDVVKTYPKDEKDEKILELENKIKELEMKINESTESNSSIKQCNKSRSNDDEYVKSKPETSYRYFPNEERYGESSNNS